MSATGGELVVAPDEPKPPVRTGAAATAVAAGILISRMFGLVRQSLMAAYLGADLAGDAFTASFKFTNILQNLFGEGALSASFIPVYTRLLARGEDDEADRLAGAIGALLGLTVAVFVLVGIVTTPWFIPVIAKGFTGEKRELTIHLTRLLWPGAGIFVLSAWCLGILNSHRKFRLPYLAPVLWNVAMIAALLWAGPREGDRRLAETLAWASVAGAALQFLIQVPTTLSLIRHLRLTLDLQSTHVRAVVKNFGPVFVARGVVQISSYIDQWIATFLPTGMVATFNYATSVSVLPVSLFGMSISAAELPEMSRAIGDQDDIASTLRSRLQRGLRNIAYFVVPSAMALLVLGEVISAVMFEHGRFTARDSLFAWGILAGSAVGLLAATMGRLYSSAYYALHDTRTPLRFATLRIFLTFVLGYICAIPLPKLLGIDPRWGTAGLTASAGVAAWIEFTLLRSTLNRRIGQTGVSARYIAMLWAASAVAALAGWGTWTFIGERRFIGGIVTLAVYGVVFLVTTVAMGIPEATAVIARIRRRR
ncbi:MAG TPA: murein biosynthesis integral membrane protein MurJ [Gemmatimonadaceae bacterium]